MAVVAFVFVFELTAPERAACSLGVVFMQLFSCFVSNPCAGQRVGVAVISVHVSASYHQFE